MTLGPLYDSVAAGYDSLQGPHAALWERLMLARVGPMLRPNSRILDAGAGTGRTAVRFLQMGHDVTLLDPSPGMLDVARAKVAALGRSASFVVGVLQDLSLPEETFDFVFADGDPLSYCIGTQHEAARQILRVLRPGGGFYVSCDNRWQAAMVFLWRGEEDRGLRCAQDGVSTDPYGNPVHAFDPAELRSLFEHAGAGQVEVTGKGHLSTLLSPQRLATILAEPRGNALEALEHFLARDSLMSGWGAHLQVVGRKPEAVPA